MTQDQIKTEITTLKHINETISSEIDNITRWLKDNSSTHTSYGIKWDERVSLKNTKFENTIKIEDLERELN